LISFLEVCAFPPIRQKKANGWGTGPIHIHSVKDLMPGWAKRRASFAEQFLDHPVESVRGLTQALA
jgi:hypothetical protein